MNKWRIHNVFHIFSLEYNTIRKIEMDKKVKNIKPDWDSSIHKKDKVRFIKNSIVYAKKTQNIIMNNKSVKKG